LTDDKRLVEESALALERELEKLNATHQQVSHKLDEAEAKAVVLEAELSTTLTSYARGEATITQMQRK
jgi:hypothetical protein